MDFWVPGACDLEAFCIRHASKQIVPEGVRGELAEEVKTQLMNGHDADA